MAIAFAAVMKAILAGKLCTPMIWVNLALAAQVSSFFALHQTIPHCLLTQSGEIKIDRRPVFQRASLSLPAYSWLFFMNEISSSYYKEHGFY